MPPEPSTSVSEDAKIVFKREPSPDDMPSTSLDDTRPELDRKKKIKTEITVKKEEPDISPEINQKQMMSTANPVKRQELDIQHELVSTPPDPIGISAQH